MYGNKYFKSETKKELPVAAVKKIMLDDWKVMV